MTKLSQLKIDPEFQNQINPPSFEETHQLEMNILKEERVLNPIITWNGYTPTLRTIPSWSWPRRSKQTSIPKTWPRQHLSPGKMKSRRQQKSPVRRSLKPSGWWTQTNAENWREPCSPKISSFYAKESRLCKPCAEKPPIRANVQTVCRKCAAAFLHKERTPNLTIWRSISGAPRALISELFSAFTASPKATVSVPSL